MSPPKIQRRHFRSPKTRRTTNSALIRPATVIKQRRVSKIEGNETGEQTTLFGVTKRPRTRISSWQNRNSRLSLPPTPEGTFLPLLSSLLLQRFDAISTKIRTKSVMEVKQFYTTVMQNIYEMLEIVDNDVDLTNPDRVRIAVWCWSKLMPDKKHHDEFQALDSVYVVYAVPFFTNGSIVWYFLSDSSKLQFDKRDLGLCANGVASYTYLITSSTVQVSLMTSNWTLINAISTIVWVDQHRSREAWFWLGLLLSVVIAVLPNYSAKTGRVLYYPELSHLMREWNDLAKIKNVAVIVRRNTGFAFSHCPGETEMALGTQRCNNTRGQSQTGQMLEPSGGGVRV